MSRKLHGQGLVALLCEEIGSCNQQHPRAKNKNIHVMIMIMMKYTTIVMSLMCNVVMYDANGVIPNVAIGFCYLAGWLNG